MSRTKAFKEQLDEHGAKWSEWRAVEVVGDFGDPDTEYHAVRGEGLGLADHSWRETLVVTGSDAVPWLQGLVTSDLFQLAEEGSGQITTAVNQVGRLIAEARVLHMPEMLVLDLEPGVLEAGLLSHLRRHIITEDVTLVDRSEQTARVSLYGEQAAELLDRVCDTEHRVTSLEEFAGTWGAMGDEDVVIQRVPLTGGPGFDVSCASEAADRVWRTLIDANDAVTPVGFDTLETLRIEAGVPRFGKELTEERIPLEAGLDHAISFNKGCYLGQEIIARLDTRGTPARLLRTLVLGEGAAPRVGADIEREGKVVGQVVSSVWSPRLQKPIALGYVKRNHNEVGTDVEVEARPASVEALGYALASTSAKV
ncbi:aminomethyl transferase family protein [Persicimonas caeni]|uniref:Aminomethyl transferase family protein n=1 Tax=Persicimonas caeni TaxID=2292766 RepID=A0A4Y6PTJ1_PERCE|nr:glycine cleavage T C-terminal barrel domain-containing protein [Persicimonas caeni]QDG51642.1 aminomethyl transferase family protein [Persicimonas caeni]QED32863.1 aminomethyl transferase family protein [Persicimonas caeni]